MDVPRSIERILPRLRCPVSGGRLEPVSLGAGAALKSAARMWPVAGGIAYLREGAECERALSELWRGDETAAIAALAAPALSSRVDRIFARVGRLLLRRPPGGGPAFRRACRRWAALRGAPFPRVVEGLFGQPPWPVPQTAAYFLDRRADPSFVAAEIAARIALPQDGPLLDIGCGAGHLLASVAAWEPGAVLIGVDELFPALLAARELLGDDAGLLCAEASRLPLADAAVSRLVSVDAFFDFPSPAASARECRRVLSADGGALLAHLHNRRVGHIYAGRCPLSPDEWAELLEPLSPVLFDERQLLAAVVDGGSFQVEPAGEPRELDGCADLLALGGVAAGPLAAEGPVDPAPVGLLRLNPHYRVEAGDTPAARVRRDGARYISEDELAGAVPGLLPDEVHLPRTALRQLPSANLPPGIPPESLAARVVLPLPPGFLPDAPRPAPRPRRRGLPRLARDLRSQLVVGRRAAELRRLARERYPEGALAILAGHQVTAGRESDPLDLKLPRAVLAGLIDALRNVGGWLGVEEAVIKLSRRAMPPGLSFALTFDDGTVGLLEQARPLLEERGLVATVFVNGPEAVRGGRFLWDDCGGGGRRERPSRLAEGACFRIGHHGRSHRALESLPADELAAEMLPVAEVDSPVMAYPFGGPREVGERCAAAARAAGFSAGLTTVPGVATAESNLHLLPRITLYDAPPEGLLRRIARLCADGVGADQSDRR